jgi:lysophospholipase L1-like esterase
MRPFFLHLIWLLLAAPLQAQTIPVEGPASPSWLQAGSRLQQLGRADPAGRLNILQLGDSHTANSYFSHRIRQRFQQQYGDAGPGFLPPGTVQGHPFAPGKITPSDEWQTVRQQGHHLPSRGEEPVRALRGLGGFVGFGLSDFQMLRFSLDRAQAQDRIVVYSSARYGSESRLRLYQGSTELPARQSGIFAAASSRAQHRSVFQLPGNEGAVNLLSGGAGNDLQLHGLIWQSDRPGVVYSSIGVVGARIGILQDWDSAVTQAQMQDLDPQLVVLAFGTNDAADATPASRQLKDSLDQAARWLSRYAPQAAVLLVLPPSATCPARADAQSARLNSVRAEMRRAASANQWRVWDWSLLTSRLCAATASPNRGEGFFAGDSIHLSRAGYEASADALFEAIVEAAANR